MINENYIELVDITKGLVTHPKTAYETLETTERNRAALNVKTTCFIFC